MRRAAELALMPLGELRAAFESAASGRWTSGADQLCRCCVELLQMDGAALSLMSQGESWGTFGSSDDVSRRLDELQYTFGEGPCLDAVTGSEPVLVTDLGRSDQTRWPAFTGAALELNVRGIFALPVADGSRQLGALGLYRHRPGALSAEELSGCLIAANAASMPLVQLIHETSTAESDDEIGARSGPKNSWERVEVYQATGMIMGQLKVGSAEALLRLRGYAFAQGMTATEVATAVLNHTIVFHEDADAGTAPDHE